MMWTATLCRDGQPVAGPVPCSEWDAATILAPMVVAWLGGPVSVSTAVVATRPSEEQPSLFDG